MINREIAPYRESDKAETPLSCLTIAEDFGRAFVQSAVIAPVWNGLGQLVTGGHLPHVSIVNEKNAENNVADSWAQKFGGAIGMAADFHLLGKLKIGPFGHVETANTSSLAQRCGQHFMRSAKQGAVYGAVFTESDRSNNMLYGRVANAGSQALTFGLLGGGSESLSGLKTLAKIKPQTLSNALSDMTIAGVVGLPAGAVGAVADATFNGRKVTLEDMKQAAVDYGIIGFTLAGINHGAAAHKRMGMKTHELRDKDGNVLFKGRYGSIREAVEDAVAKMVLLDNVDLRGQNLDGANLKGGHFMHAKLEGATLVEANCENANFYRADCEGTKFNGAKLNSTFFRSVNLKNADFDSANCKNANFIDADCEGAKFNSTKLDSVKINYARLKAIAFTSANCENGKFLGADCDGAKFNGMNLGSVCFNGAELKNADLTGADVRNSMMKGVNIDRATTKMPNGMTIDEIIGQKHALEYAANGQDARPDELIPEDYYAY